MELMRISTVPCHAGGTNPLLCRSSASKLYSFEASTQPAVVSPIFPRDSLCHHLRWYWDCIVRSSSNVEFFVGFRSTLEQNWNLHISFCVQVMESHLQDFQQLQAGFTMFRTVFLCTAGVPRHRLMPLFFFASLWASRVGTSESHVVLEVFQVLALRGAEQVASLIEDQYADDAPARNSKQWTLILEKPPHKSHTWM